ncbi:DUF3265 domain-containing protein [Vibrio vulnificus]|nr:DUF3265 domain-containing protein [Vibrio vulnificus]OZS58860.1 DUF3265 domain-containing protein [Vibrio vulnificus]OZS62883.1 DUF3265 domain-containing protein [Vibrio vulnificus]PAO27494.1 DUF3265 domain-containing protein [Vibrio vulnificus]PAO36443.1 DUF3265 domain-containing protein [Vibrio vulnificus]
MARVQVIGEWKNCLTNASRGTANAWHFYYALLFVVTVLCSKLVVALAAP